MIALQLFPSRTVSLYMGRMFLVRTFAILTALVIVVQFLDLLGETGNIVAHQGNADGQGSTGGGQQLVHAVVELEMFGGLSELHERGLPG